MERNSSATRKRNERLAFEIYLRTGKIVAFDNDLQVKFNPWHDPEDGRFTFAHQGTYAGGGSANGQEAGATRTAKRRPVGPTASTKHPDAFRPGGGSFGGVGANGSWSAPSPPAKREASKPHVRRIVSGSASHSRRLPKKVISTPATSNPPVHKISGNGYNFEVNSKSGSDRRVARAYGVLQVTETSRRSRRSQSQAGGADRKPTDDGGHFIGRRFNGPHEWYNHFAQNSNFNRGLYRSLEDGWAKDVTAGKRVYVDIVPHYTGRSTRPDLLTINWAVDGNKFTKIIPNSRRERKAIAMTDSKYDLLGQIYNAIGEECLTIVAGHPAELYLYAYADEGGSGGAIFIDEGKSVRYYDPTHELCGLILDAWEECPDEKWIIMEYEIKGASFDAKLIYHDEVDPDLNVYELRDFFLQKRFGDKPVIYPPMPGDTMALALDAAGNVRSATNKND